MIINKKKLGLLIGIVVFLGIVNTTPSIKAPTIEQTISTVADKDTYVNTYYATSNYGGVDYLYCGYYFGGDIVEAYFHFDFSDKPSSFKKAEIALDIWGIYQTFNVTICLIEQSWAEYTMTWLNKPDKNETITSIIVTSSDVYTIDVTDYIAGRSEISICAYVAVENYVNDYLFITAREETSTLWEQPKLIWTYDEYIPSTVTITRPTASTKGYIDTDFEITWTSTGLVPQVRISMYKGATQRYYYTSPLDNDGSVIWHIPSDIETGDNWRIYIYNSLDSSENDWSDYFEITTRPSGPDIPGYLPEITMLLVFSGIAFLILFMKRKILKK